MKTTPAASASEASRYFLDDAATPPCGDARRGLSLFQTYGMSKLGGAVYKRPYSYEKRTHFAVDVGWLRIDRRARSLVLAPLNNPSGNRRYLIICAKVAAESGVLKPIPAMY